MSSLARMVFARSARLCHCNPCCSSRSLLVGSHHADELGPRTGYDQFGGYDQTAMQYQSIPEDPWPARLREGVLLAFSRHAVTVAKDPSALGSSGPDAEIQEECQSELFLVRSVADLVRWRVHFNV